jgi:peptidoglycan hydrolase FlgJ
MNSTAPLVVPPPAPPAIQANLGAPPTGLRMGSSSPAKMQRTAQDFEAVFLTQMFELMSQGLQSDEMFGGGHAEELTRSMLNDQYGKAVAKAGGIGVSDAIYREMVRLQEAAR